ncbi:MAG: short-chain dehydrogenase, partial [Verrucomicrobia bacterium]|nr:short-chain dehydrogenase [Verrucomicrobiota bacterium]
CASKFALEALSDACRVELRGSGIAVSLIEPGPIASAFRTNSMAKAEANPARDGSPYGEAMAHEVERKRGTIKEVRGFTKPPEAVGMKIIHALESTRPKRRYCVTVPAYAGAVLRRVAPYALLDAVLARRVQRMVAKAAAGRNA